MFHVVVVVCVNIVLLFLLVWLNLLCSCRGCFCYGYAMWWFKSLDCLCCLKDSCECDILCFRFNVVLFCLFLIHTIDLFVLVVSCLFYTCCSFIWIIWINLISMICLFSWPISYISTIAQSVLLSNFVLMKVFKFSNDLILVCFDLWKAITSMAEFNQPKHMQLL